MPPIRNGSLLDGERYRRGVALLSPCGWGNLGDAAIMDSAIHAIRTRLPGTPIFGLSLNPRDTATRHGIPAFTCSGFSYGDYGVAPDAVVSDSIEEELARGETNPPPNPPRLLRILKQIAPRTPVLSTAWKVVRLVRGDVRHRLLLAEPTGHLRYVVVVGGGQLDDFWGGALGHPYVLWRWTRHGHQVHARVVILSVGTGTLSTPLSRLLVRRALASADYRSFRDEGSRTLVGGPLVDRDPIVPDLAYGLPTEVVAQPRTPGSLRPLIGVSPMPHCDPRTGPIRDEARYKSYLGRLAAVAARLLETGHDLLLYSTNTGDSASIDDLYLRIVGGTSTDLHPRIRVHKVQTVRDLFTTLASVRLVVASRLHGILLPHLAAIPTFALAPERKVNVLMKTMNLERYSMPIDEFDPPEAVRRIHELLRTATETSKEIARRVAEFRRQVEEQYDLVFGASDLSNRSTHGM